MEHDAEGMTSSRTMLKMKASVLHLGGGQLLHGAKQGRPAPQGGVQARADYP
jgi:hypothetical protein